MTERSRRFHCSRCGYEFIKFKAVSIERCSKCENVVIEKGHSGSFTDWERMKQYFYKYPKAWEDNIKHRTTVAGKTYLTDNSGVRLGEMPKPYAD